MADDASADAETPAEAVEAEAPLSPKADKKAEKEALRLQIEEIEKMLPSKRGELVRARDDVKDAGEGGYLLLAANFERARVAARSDLQGQAGYGKLEAMRPLLPFAERFAALQAGSDGSEVGSDAVHSWYRNIHNNLVALLEAEKVVPFEALPGEKYQWKRHLVAESRPSDTVAKEMVIEAVASGYMMGDEVLREASVVISTGPVEKAAPAAKAPAAKAADANAAKVEEEGEETA